MPPAPGITADEDLWLAELGLLAGDDDVAVHRQLVAAAQRVAAHRRDQRLLDAADAIPRREGSSGHLDGRRASHLGDVRPGGEGALARAGQHDAADGVIGVKLLQPVGQLGDERPVERIELVGAVDGGGGDGLVALDDDILLRHGAIGSFLTKR